MLKKLSQGDLGRIWSIERKMNRIDSDLSNMIGNFVLLREELARLETRLKYLEVRKPCQ